MELWNIFFASIGSVIALFLLTKLMGNRQLSQLSMYDYITGITIGSIAAEMATSLEGDFLKPLLAMVIYAVVSYGVSVLSCKSVRLRRLMAGTSLVLFENGKLYRENLRAAKLDLSDFLCECRNQGYFNIADLRCAVMEHNGRISFLPQPAKRPLTPSDMNIPCAPEGMVANVILDGQIMHKNLKHTGNNETWLRNELKKQGYKNVGEVFLATCDVENQLTVYAMLRDKMEKDLFD